MSESRERLKKNLRRQRLPKLLVQLQKKIELLERILFAEGLRVSGKASDFAKEVFERSPLGYQRKVIRELDVYTKVLYEFKNSGGDLRDSHRLAWAYLKARQLQPTANTFSSLENDDLIEIFNDQHQQIFRSLNFFETVHASLFDLVVLDWLSLFKRDSQIEEKLFICFSSLYRQARQWSWLTDIQEHHVDVRFSNESFRFFQTTRLCCALKRRQASLKRVEAVMFVSQVSFQAGSQKVMMN